MSAAILGPAAASVGLQVLLQPYGSAPLGHAACTAAGLIYPAYCSLKAAEAPSTSAESVYQQKKWLVYWSIYGLITAAERPLDRLLQWVPYYHALKLLLLVWLQSPSYEGAARLYREGLRPYLATWQPQLDAFLGALLRSLRRPELLMLAEGLHHFASRTPFLEWFVRGPDGRPTPRPRPAFISDAADPDGGSLGNGRRRL